jgi:hypothetical protein
MAVIAAQTSPEQRGMPAPWAVLMLLIKAEDERNQ